MKVQRLVMNSFGNQQERIIDFSDGVNLIMGTDVNTLNTVRSFIDGMLFGLTPENKVRYRPVQGKFSGSIYLEDESGSQLRVERDFETDQYIVKTSDGDDVTADYSDEYGNLALLPAEDSIFAGETIEYPETPQKSLKRLSELKSKREAYVRRHNYEEMLAEREALLKDINQQRELEDRLEKNTAEISQKEIRIEQLINSEGVEITETDRKIAAIREENQKIETQIKELEVKESLIRGDRENVLKRDLQSADDQLELVDRRIRELSGEKESYQKKLSTLEDSFKIDREELKQDYEIYRDEVKRESGESREPLADRMATGSIWLYALIILLGIAGVGVALYNPVDVLGRAVIFVICFFSIFLILMSAFALYLRINQNKILALAEGIPEDIEAQESNINAIIHKYNQKSPEEFNIFYNNARKIYLKTDNLKSDLTNINREIGLAEIERSKILAEKEEAQQALNTDQNRNDPETDEQIQKLVRKQKQNQVQIDELEEQKQKESSNSIWKLKEESMRLEETNRELRELVGTDDQMLEDFNRLQRRIDRYESKVNDYDREITEIEDSLKSSKENFYLSYALPEHNDYDLEMARQFGFGLQKNLDQGMDVPRITLDPFAVAGTKDDRLIEKLKGYIKNKQVLIFSSSLVEQMILTKHKIKHNGIYIADRKVG